MLGDKDAAANIAVKDLATARKFYAETLGLTPVAAEGEELIVFRSGKSTVNVYQSRYAGTNQATTVTWVVGQGMEDILASPQGQRRQVRAL
jgi:catechol 2,3-dioxygenase-like lactoylglutathione lyase family enzyme